VSSAGPIDSPQNTYVAAARSLLTRKGRSAASLFLVEGPHAVSEVLTAAGYRVREVFVTEPAAVREVELLRAVATAQIPVRTVTERAMASLGDTVTPQGMVAVVEIPNAGLEISLTAGLRLGVLLERIADPGNAGTVIRTADAAGAGLVATTTGSVDIWSGKCVRASAGSLFHLPVTPGVELDHAIDVAREAGCAVLATAADGDDDLDDLIDSGVLIAPTIWAFGNEAQGISVKLRSAADRTVRLPVHGRAESLNLAATAAICLYASARAQRS
jgi:RNA methyltransferase, TrmH family